MGNDIQRTDDRLGAIMATDAIRDQILGGLAPWMDEKQFTSAALAVFSNNEFAGFSAGAKLKAVLQFAVLGLYPGPANHAYIIPRGNSLDVMPGFRGYVFHARKLPGVHDVTAHLVHEGDVFEVVTAGAGNFDVVKHSFDPLPPKGGREFRTDGSGLRGAYVKMEMKDGKVRFHFVTHDTIMLAKSCAQTKNVWNKHPGPMFLKTALRDAQARGFFHGNDRVEQRMAKLLAQDDLVSITAPAKLDAPPPEKKSTTDRVMALLAEAEAAAVPSHDPETGEIASDPEGTQPHASSEQGEVDLPFSDEERNGSKKK